MVGFKALFFAIAFATSYSRCHGSSRLLDIVPRCADNDTLPQRNQEETKEDPRVADAVASAASGRLAGVGHVRRVLVRRAVARPRARTLPDRAVRVGQPVLLARGVARGRAAHRSRGPSAASRARPRRTRAGAG